MKIKSKDFSFRKGESKIFDIPQLESCRINSIKNCKIYSKKTNQYLDKFKTKLGRTNSKNYSISYGKSYFGICN